MAALHTILVPVDGSAPSLAALAHAVALAEDAGATVEVLHVDGPDEFVVGSSTPISPSVRAEISRRMEDAVARAEAQLGDHLSRRTTSGDPLRTIVESASEGAFDLIVMGTHGRIGRMRTMLGSVAEGVIRNAPCPVLTVREPSIEYQSFAERRHGTPSLAEQVERHHG
ncbi:MAG: universal stress protein [Labilithrix sp.]|nr:universal stress protein [Labilithrix sp.]